MALEIVEMDPKNLTLVKSKKHHLYDPRVHDPVDRKSEEAPYAKLKAFGWTHGVIEAVREEIDGKTYSLVVDGKQRTNALLVLNEEREKAGLPPILARVFFGKGDEISQFLRMWGANHGARKNSSLVDCGMIQNLIRLSMQAAGPDKAKEARQNAEKQAAVILGCSVDTVKNRMRLNDLAPEVKDALKSGQITDSDALKIVGQGKTVRTVEDQVALLKKTPKVQAPGKRRKGHVPVGGGKRAGPKRPSVRALQKVLEAVGDGHEHASALRFAAGVLSQSAYFKIVKLPEPGKRVVVK